MKTLEGKLALRWLGQELALAIVYHLAARLGLPGFAENLDAQEVEVIQVDWEPPAGGDPELIDLLDQLL